jgi:hypothetical protein
MEGEVFVLPKWDAHNVANFEELLKINSDGRKVLNFASCALINTMPMVGITEITEETKRDLWIRIAIFHAMKGSLFYFERKKDKKKLPLFLTQQDIYRHTGLSTEGPNYSFVEFCDKWVVDMNIEEKTSPAWCANNYSSMLDICLEKKE